MGHFRPHHTVAFSESDRYLLSHTTASVTVSPLVGLAKFLGRKTARAERDGCKKTLTTMAWCVAEIRGGGL